MMLGRRIRLCLGCIPLSLFQGEIWQTSWANLFAKSIGRPVSGFNISQIGSFPPTIQAEKIKNPRKPPTRFELFWKGFSTAPSTLQHNSLLSDHFYDPTNQPKKALALEEQKHLVDSVFFLLFSNKKFSFKNVFPKLYEDTNLST